MNDSKRYTIKKLVTDAIFSVLLLIMGMFKIPSFLPGTEFQLSAPFAVSIAKNCGFKRYLMIGIVASISGFILGVQNILNIVVAMIYRVVVGVLLVMFKNSKIALVVSGPCGTLVSRIVLALILHTNMQLLIIYAVPGMIFTAVTAPVFIKLEERIIH